MAAAAPPIVAVVTPVFHVMLKPAGMRMRSLFAAVIVGGRGNNFGAVLGALLVPVGFEEATRYLPPFGPPGLIPALEWVCIGGLILGFLWFRPRGVLPERRRVFAARPATVDVGEQRAARD